MVLLLPLLLVVMLPIVLLPTTACGSEHPEPVHRPPCPTALGPLCPLCYLPPSADQARTASHRYTMRESYPVLLHIAHDVMMPSAILPIPNPSLHPTNPFLLPSPAMQVADFGLSVQLEPAQEVVKTGSYGTITHCAPEVLESYKMSKAGDMYRYAAYCRDVFSDRRLLA